MARKDLRPFRFDLLREGDTFHSRSDRLYAGVIAYATSWEKSKAGREAARKAMKDKNFPNHSGSIHESWGQKYAVEASPRGYIRGDLDDYRTDSCRIVQVYRWRGFDNAEIRAHCSMILERWARKATSPKYDWYGAIVSSPLGRYLFSAKQREAASRLFCSEGVVYLHAMCGIAGGRILLPETPLAEVRALIQGSPREFPLSFNPYDVLRWQAQRSDFTAVADLYK